MIVPTREATQSLQGVSSSGWRNTTIGGSIFLFGYLAAYLALNVTVTLRMHSIWAGTHPGEYWLSNIGRYAPNSAITLIPVIALSFLAGQYISRSAGSSRLARLGLISLITLFQVVILEVWTFVWMWLRAKNFGLPNFTDHSSRQIIGTLIFGYIFLWVFNQVLSIALQRLLHRRPNPSLNSDPGASAWSG